MLYETTLAKLIEDGNEVLGIDVSACQGKIDFSIVLEKQPWIKFVIIKATDNTWMDSQFINSYKQIMNRGDILTGIYHVINANGNPDAQIGYLNQVLTQNNLAMPKITLIDFETAYSNFALAQNNLLKEIQLLKNSKHNVGIYSYQGFIQPFVPALSKVDLTWAIANYSNIKPTHPGIDRVHMRQFSGWVPYVSCQKTPCFDKSHSHGCLLNLNNNQVPTDIDILDGDIFAQLIQY